MKIRDMALTEFNVINNFQLTIYEFSCFGRLFYEYVHNTIKYYYGLLLKYILVYVQNQ